MPRRLPRDPNFWLLLGISIYGVANVGALAMVLTHSLAAPGPVLFGFSFVLPPVTLLLVLGLHFGAARWRFHPGILLGVFVILALAFLVNLNVYQHYALPVSAPH